MTKEQLKKLATTTECIYMLLLSSGPQSLAQILAECRAQAYPAYMAKALQDLVDIGEVYYDHDEEIFDII